MDPIYIVSIWVFMPNLLNFAIIHLHTKAFANYTTMVGDFCFTIFIYILFFFFLKIKSSHVLDYMANKIKIVSFFFIYYNNIINLHFFWCVRHFFYSKIQQKKVITFLILCSTSQKEIKIKLIGLLNDGINIDFNSFIFCWWDDFLL